MKRLIIAILFIGIIITLAQPGASNMLLELLFLGIVPGTDVQIPFWAMIIIFLGGGSALIYWLGSQPLYIGGIAKQDQTARKLARKKVAKKVRKTPVSTRGKRNYQTTTKSRPSRATRRSA